jgi:flagellar hook-basal body complex protein FliE
MPISIGGSSPLSSLIKIPSIGGGGASAQPAGADFGSALKQAVGALGQLGAKADTSSLALAKGEPVDVHEVMLNTEQASLGFSLALQVRNKLVDAYQEVMRMSV